MSENKYVWIVVVVLVILGFVFFIRNNQSAQNGQVTGDITGTEAGAASSTATTSDPIALANALIQQNGNKNTAPAATTGNTKPAAQVPAQPPVKTDINNNRKNMIAVMHTTKGDITIELNNKEVPDTVDNFYRLANEGFYNNVKFHRVIKGFMIQSGDPLTKDDSAKAKWGTGGPGYQFDDEFTSSYKNETGTIAMANSGPNTNGSQFFINTADNHFLDTKHTVFGKVIAGMDVVRAIESTPTDSTDKPISPITITSIAIQE